MLLGSLRISAICMMGTSLRLHWLRFLDRRNSAVKDPQKLQEKLAFLLRESQLKVGFNLSRPLDDLQLREIAWVVEDYVARNADSHECELFSEWIDSYKFYAKSAKVG
jgi:hypothetical protein